MSTPSVEYPRRPSRQWRGLRDLDPIIISCRDHHQAHRPAEKRTGLCDACLADLELVLSDVPYLLDDLDVAISGQVEFVERGQDPTKTEEEQLRGGNHPAVLAHQRLVRALEVAGDWFDACHPEQLADQLRRVLPELADEPLLRRVAREVSAAASRAHRVVDAPTVYWYYGPCPWCGTDIVQERVHGSDQLITCARCEYAATVAEHQAAQLTLRDDSWLPEERLVSALVVNDQPITRKQLRNWVNRHGLAREKLPWPRWVNGHLQTNDVYQYRVGDVRDLAARRNAAV